MFEVPQTDPISPALRALLGLFATDLDTVQFPDTGLDVLEAATQQVKACAEAVSRAQVALETARRALNESQEALLQKGQRALAYARVYAEERPELAQKLEAISLPRPPRKVSGSEVENGNGAPKRRGRPPKTRPSASLFAEGGASPLVTSELDAASAGRPPSA